MESEGANKKRLASARAYYWTHKKERLAYGKKYREERAEEIRLRKEKYRKAHKEQTRAYDKKYRQDHAKERQAYQREYRQIHAESPEHLEVYRAARLRWYYEHRDESLERSRSYRQTDRGRALERQRKNKRRALKAGVPSTLTRLQWQNALACFGSRCAYCGSPAKGLHQDHVIPLSIGGGYIAENIVPACARCNLSKHNSFLGDWAMGRGMSFVLPDALVRVRNYIERLEL